MRITPKARYFFAVALTAFFYATGYLLEIDAQTLDGAYLAQRVEYYGIGFFAVFYYLFVRDYGNQPIRGRWKLALLFALPAVALIFVNAYPVSRLYFGELDFVASPTPHLMVERGLFYRLHTFYSLALIIGLATRTGQAVSLMMLDIDFFKRVNDTRGHQCGDRVLRQLAVLMEDRLRRTDIGGRCGGEEFCVLLPATDTKGARIIAEEIRTAVEAAEFAPEGDSLRVTVSIGIAQYIPARHPTLESLIADADNALYAAKDGGRNRVESAAVVAVVAP